ncbi:MAG: hypothetical protein ACLFVQ_10275 [Chitinispirillaceae bacterium]
MKHITVFILSLFVAVSAEESVDIVRESKNIQVDGFLMEWNSGKARQWKNSDWTWDAVNTPAGVAGYFSLGGEDPCSSWVFEIVPEGEDKEFQIRIPGIFDGEFYAVDEARYDSLGRPTVEWLIPWSALGKEKAVGKYVVRMKAGSGCEDNLEPVVLNGVREEKVKIITPKLISKGLLIVLLLVLYVRVRKYVKKAEAKNRKSEYTE